MRGALRTLCVVAGLLGAAVASRAEVFPLVDGNDLIGEDGQVETVRADTLPDIARRNHLGFDEIVAANPGVDADHALLRELGLGLTKPEPVSTI